MLRSTLQSLTQLVSPPAVSWEVLVVNNNSTDGTEDVVRSFERQLPLRRVLEKEPGLCPARNRALAECRSEFILWTDDDVLIEPHWLSEFVAATRAFPTASGFGGRIEPWFQTPPDPELAAAFPWLESGFCGLDHGEPARVLPANEFVYGANMGYRMASVKGRQFDKRLGPKPGVPGGGDELAYEADLRKDGADVVWWPTMLIKHYVDPSRTTLRYLASFAREKGRELILHRYPNDGPPAPPWLWRLWAEAMAKSTLASSGIAIPFPAKLWSGNLPQQRMTGRLRSFLWRREREVLGGMLAAHREISSTAH